MDEDDDGKDGAPPVPWDPSAFKISSVNGGNGVFSFTNSQQSPSAAANPSPHFSFQSASSAFQSAGAAGGQVTESVESNQGGEKEEAGGSAPSSLGKRSKDERSSSNNNIEDVFEQITMKMKSLSTTNTNEEKVDIFISVLDINAQEAGFFLESALWDLEAAVALYLESSGDNNRLVTNGYNRRDDEGGKRSRRGPSNFQMPQRYHGREVIIQDLPSGWTAKVSRSTGTVYFLHIATGHRQNEVPQGFADLQEDGHNNGNGDSKAGKKESEGEMDEAVDSQVTEAQSQSFTESGQSFNDVIGNPNEAPSGNDNNGGGQDHSDMNFHS